MLVRGKEKCASTSPGQLAEVRSHSVFVTINTSLVCRLHSQTETLEECVPPLTFVDLISCVFTFKEDKLSIRSLVGGVDARRQALPELIDLHGVTLLHLVVPQAPEPAVLQHNQ